jgi:hypothetical protein
MISKMETIEIPAPRVGRPKGTRKTGGRQKGTVNRVTADIRQALRDLAEGNAPAVQGWLDRVASNDPGEALRLWLALLRFVTPTLQAAAITDITPPKRASDQLCKFTDRELLEMIVHSPEAVTLLRQGMAAPLSVAPQCLPEPDQATEAEDDEELLR